MIWFNSLRKFFYINFGSECNILKDDTILRSKKKDTCSFKAPSSYAKFIKNEKEHYDLKKNVKKYISKDFFKLNFKKISEKRLERFHIYHKIFKKNNMLKFNFREIEGPLYYPLLIKNGFKKRKELLKKKIYTPILWNEFLKQNIKKFKFEINLSKNCLFLPVNEYLSISDIDKIINSIKNFDN